MKRILLLAVLVATVLTANAQFTLSGELRPRFEFRDGYKKLPESGTTPAIMVSQRTRLNVDWKYKFLKTRISLQDVRVWGDEAMKKDVAGIGLYEGWIEMGICDSLSVKVGRQELIYDNQRLLSNNNWGAKGVTHDALLLQYKNKGWSLDVAGAFNQSRDTTFSTDYNYSLANYKALGFVILSKKLGKFKLTGLSINDAYQKKNTKNTTYLRTTNGLIAAFQTSRIGAFVRGFYQSGQYETGAWTNAWYAGFDVAGKINDHLSLTLGGEWQSGQDSTDKTEKHVNSFSPLYGSNHSFNGYMDYFTKPADTKNTGLLDAYLKVETRLCKTHKIMLDLHYFSITNQFADHVNGGNMNPFLGAEGDITYKWSIIKEVDLQVGYSAMFGSKTLAAVAGGNAAHIAHWAYAMITVKPVFFQHTQSGN
jgi:hypothetical protein